MEADFWHQRWQNNELGFHEQQANGLLVEHFETLAVEPGNRIFVPLCGKTRDIGWLLGQGYQIAGVELSEKAVTALFDDLGVDPDIEVHGALVHYSAPDLDIFCGDIFELSRDSLGPVDAIYDRAALVALPPDMRKRYAAHLTAITETTPQFLICFEYDQSQMDGPPFSITTQEVERLYGPHYGMTRIVSQTVDGGMKGKCPATETVWRLSAH